MCKYCIQKWFTGLDENTENYNWIGLCFGSDLDFSFNLITWTWKNK